MDLQRFPRVAVAVTRGEVGKEQPRGLGIGDDVVLDEQQDVVVLPVFEHPDTQAGAGGEVDPLRGFGRDGLTQECLVREGPRDRREVGHGGGVDQLNRM
ncbi:hypothetical protein HFP72_29540 [Nocardiopsis sp. ARC36]